MKNLKSPIKTSIYYNGIKKYKEQLERRIDFLEKKQPPMSNVHLKYKLQKDNIFYYARKKGDNNKPKYIKLQNKEELERLTKTWYIQKILPKLKQNLCAANKFLAMHSGYEEADIANAIPIQLQEKTAELYKSNQLYIKEWLAQEYMRNPYKPETLIHDTAKGDKVRSKSEVMIADELFEHTLPYKPEYPLFLKQLNKKAYPDFTILHPETLKVYIWEHFGMMDDPDYASEAIKKISAYAREGYFIGDNLICTFETSDSPLTRGTIELYINKFFLSK